MGFTVDFGIHVVLCGEGAIVFTVYPQKSEVWLGELEAKDR